VPLAFIQGADDIELVDAPAIDAKLAILRELALVAAADVVDRQLERYLEHHGVQSQWGTQERILVCVTARSDASRMIASGRRNTSRFHGEPFVVYVEQPELTAADRVSLACNLALAREAEAHVEVLPPGDPVEAARRSRGPAHPPGGRD
jgi:two-component system sensor histidine kinase KdpD